MATFMPSTAALDGAADQAFSAIDLRETLASSDTRLTAARFAIFAKGATSDDLRAAVDTLIRHGDHIDHMRAEILLAAMQRSDSKAPRHA